MKIKEQEIKGTFDGFTPFQIECDGGYIVGTYIHKEDRISISHAMCQGVFKYLVDYVTKKFNTQNVLIYNVMNLEAWKKLQGFLPIVMMDEMMKEEVVCLEGKWIKH